MDVPEIRHAVGPGKDLVVGFGDADEHELKGDPDRWHLDRVVD